MEKTHEIKSNFFLIISLCYYLTIRNYLKNKISYRPFYYKKPSNYSIDREIFIKKINSCSMKLRIKNINC